MQKERKKVKKAVKVTAKTEERIIATALANPNLGPVRLARLLGDEGGEDVTRGQVYRILRSRGLQTSKLRSRFPDEQGRHETQVGSSTHQEAPIPPLEIPEEQARKFPGQLDTIQGIEHAAPPVSAPAEEKRRASAGAVPKYAAAQAGAAGKAEKAHPQKINLLLRGINLLLAAFIVFLGVRIGTRLYPEWQEPSTIATPILASKPDTPAKPVATAEPKTSFSDYSAILNRNLFGSASRTDSDAPREAVDIKAIGIAGKEVGLKLIGTVVGKDHRQNYAVVEVDKTRNQEILREKDTVVSVRIKRILRNNVIIQTATGEKRLTVGENAVSATSGTKFEPAAARIDVPAASQVNDGDSEITIEIPRSDITQALPEIRRRLEGPNASTNRPAGRPDGFYLSRVAAVDVLYRIGLRTGDVIKSVDGEAVASLDDAEVLIGRLSEGGDFAILVERRGKLQSLNLSVN